MSATELHRIAGILDHHASVLGLVRETVQAAMPERYGWNSTYEPKVCVESLLREAVSALLQAKGDLDAIAEEAPQQ